MITSGKMLKNELTMKKIFNISLALAIFGAIACNTAPVEEISGNYTTVTASLVSSRTALADGVKTIWSAEDKIEVNGTTFTLSQGAGEATATFISQERLADAASYTATYPAGVTAVPTAQTAVEGSFDPAAALAIGTSQSLNNILFEHQHALLKLSVPQNASKVEALGYTLSGNIEQGKTYYLAIAAGTYEAVEVKVDDVVVKTGGKLEAVNGHIYNLGLVEAAAVGIYTADDLLAFAAAVEAQIAAEQTPDGGEWKDENGVVNIYANIDMTGKEWKMISNFSGTLEGNNFTIDNLVHETSASSAAFFKNITDGTVQNLTFGKGCKFSASGLDTDSKSYAASVVARVMAGATIKNIKNYATISGATYSAGICGAANLKKNEVVFENCTNYGSVTYPAQTAPANICVAGICGDSEKGVTYRNCCNEGALTNLSTGGNKFNAIGGILATGSDHSHYNNSNKGAIHVDVRGANNVYIGGIQGRGFRYHAEECSNTGAITIDNNSETASLYLSGCFGTIEGNATRETKVYKCSNTASLTANCKNSKDVVVSGIISWLKVTGCEISECSNSGNMEMHSIIGTSYVAGIVAIQTSDMANASVKVASKILNCTNTGSMDYISNSSANSPWSAPAGICGKCTSDFHIEGCVNRGNITADTITRANPGGIGSEINCDVVNCTNYGTVYTKSTHVDYYSGTAGIVSRYQQAGKVIRGCKNYGTIIYNGKGFTKANTNNGIVGQGGICGILYNGSVEKCENYGIVLGNEYDASLGLQSYINAKGSIIGWGGNNAAVTISGCKVGGAIGSCVDTDEDMGASKATAITAENYADYVYGGVTKNTITVTDCSFAALAE